MLRHQQELVDAEKQVAAVSTPAELVRVSSEGSGLLCFDTSGLLCFDTSEGSRLLCSDTSKACEGGFRTSGLPCAWIPCSGAVQ